MRASSRATLTNGRPSKVKGVECNDRTIDGESAIRILKYRRSEASPVRGTTRALRAARPLRCRYPSIRSRISAPSALRLSVGIISALSASPVTTGAGAARLQCVPAVLAHDRSQGRSHTARRRRRQGSARHRRECSRRAVRSEERRVGKARRGGGGRGGEKKKVGEQKTEGGWVRRKSSGREK